MSTEERLNRIEESYRKDSQTILTTLTQIEDRLLGNLDNKEPGLIEEIRTLKKNQEAITEELNSIKLFTDDIRGKKFMAYGAIIVISVIAGNVADILKIGTGFFTE